MQILFQGYYYTDEYFDKIQTGIVSAEDDCDLDECCILKPILINVLHVTSAKGGDGHTAVQIGEVTYLLKVEFSDYLNMVPHHKAMVLKQKWAN